MQPLLCHHLLHYFLSHCEFLLTLNCIICNFVLTHHIHTLNWGGGEGMATLPPFRGLCNLECPKKLPTQMLHFHYKIPGNAQNTPSPWKKRIKGMITDEQK